MCRLRTVIQSLTLALILAGTATAQQTRHPGIDLYNQGKIDQAILSLEAASKQKEFSSNGDIWNTLGLAYFAKNDFKRARKAFEMAIKTAPAVAAFHGNLSFIYLLTEKLKDARAEAERAIQLSSKDNNAHFVIGRINLAEQKYDEAAAEADTMIAANPAVPDGYMLKADSLLARLGKMVDAGWDVRDELDLLQKASEVLKTGSERCKTSPVHKAIDDQAEAVAVFYRYFAKEPSAGGSASGPTPSNVVPMKITGKPFPAYSDRARAAGLSGRVRLAVLFGSDGRVQRVLPLSKLGSGLDESALYAAQRIKFVPQMVDGKPVSVVKIVEYTFSVY